jgi:hypothetical protein
MKNLSCWALNLDLSHAACSLLLYGLNCPGPSVNVVRKEILPMLLLGIGHKAYGLLCYF